MAISNANAAKINKMNRAAQGVSLGTAFQAAQTSITALEVGTVVTAGSAKVTAAQCGASAIIINTGLGTSFGQVINFVRSGSLITYISASQVAIANASGSITVTGMLSDILLTNDIVHWLAF